jgi:DNA helicase HerA-like ATPase
MMSRLDYFINNSDCAFMKEGQAIYSSEEDYLKRVFGISEDSNVNQLVVLDSSEVSRDILELLTGVINRLIFDYRKRKIGNARRANPVHIVLDEAHRYIKKDTEYLLKENIFERIAREGRKFSMYLMVSSQRPSELSQTVLSQCGNYIIHRIQNEVDMNYIYSVLPYFSADYISRIKQSIPGEALIFGNCVPMPLSVKIEKAKPEPNSDNCIISVEWYKKSVE